MSGKEKNVKKKKHKLLVQISIIVNLIFVATLVFTSFTDYFITQDAYLSSKNEMIKRDMFIIRDYTVEITELEWLIKYGKEHSEDMTRELTEEESERVYTDEFREALDNVLFEVGVDIDKLSPEYQFSIARILNDNLKVAVDTNEELNYADIYLIDILNENESFMLINSQKTIIDTYIKYDASEHSAVREIFSDKPLNEDELIFEVYYDKDNGGAYYIGYSPIIINGKTVCYLCIKYDWSQFRSELINQSIKTMIMGFIVLAVLNALLMLFIYMNAIRPLSKVEAGVQEYMENKDSDIVSDKMSRIKVRNEIGRVADRFSDLAKEIDKHTNEILKLNSEKERISTELSLATSIQSSMLPDKFPAFPDRKEFDIFASMDPAKEVGGDFYDLFLIDDDHLAMVIADVSGKGVPAALFMMSSMILINDHALMGGTPAEILDRINKQVCKNNKAHMFVTVWLGIFEISTGKLTASSAGHEFPMINTSGKFELLKDKHGMPVGAFKKAKYKDYELTLKKGDSLFLYTDGVAEATDADNQLFGTKRTLEALNTDPDALPEELLKNVRKAVDAFVKDAPQFDDLTMLGFRYFGKEENNNE